MTTPTTVTKMLLIALVAGVAAETTGCALTGTSSGAVVPDQQAPVRGHGDKHRRDVKVYRLPGNGGNPVWIGTIGSLNTMADSTDPRRAEDLLGPEFLEPGYGTATEHRHHVADQKE